MYEPDHTIAAVSSPPYGTRTLVRISGPRAFEVLEGMLTECVQPLEPGISTGRLIVDDDLTIDAILYVFVSPNSYTADDLVELHINANQPVTIKVLDNLFAAGLRMAGPGEFTARSYLNGKIDLSQAEAVGEIVASSNKYQLSAAERLLSGRLTQATEKNRGDILNVISLLEAGLDFTEQDIQFISTEQAVEKVRKITDELNELLNGSVSCEAAIDLPSIGIAGRANAGKSSLLNTLLGSERSIVSSTRATTRDVLTGLLELETSRCVLFDCAGIAAEGKSLGILDELGRQAAISALNYSSLNILCVDISNTDHPADAEIKKLIETKPMIFLATKSDLLGEDELTKRLAELKNCFGTEFLPISTVTGQGIESLRDQLDTEVFKLTAGGAEAATGVALTNRHRRAIGQAAEHLSQAIEEIETGGEEVAAMLLRAGWKSLSDVGQEAIDEEILTKIFANFCIGK